MCQRPLTLLHCCAGSLAGNRLCGVYNSHGHTWGTYTAEGITKLCEGLKGSSVTSLECAAAQRLLFMSAPADTPHSHACSLSANFLCGLHENGDGDIQGTYTAEGINKLCEALKESAVTSLECAATLDFALLVNAR